MIFCKGSISNINNLKDLFDKYGMASGQIISPQKYTVYFDNISERRQHVLADILGFSIGTIPFIYLGISIFKGKPKVYYYRLLQTKLEVNYLRGKYLFFPWRVETELVKNIVHNMLVYSFPIYQWPASLLADVDRWTRNFIWCGDVEKRKMTTLAWHKVCKPKDEGGVGLRSVKSINKNDILCLAWKYTTSDQHWAILLRARTMRNRGHISYHIDSSIWPSIKVHLHIIHDNSQWQIWNGDKVNFWPNHWLIEPLVSYFNIDPTITLEAKVKHFILNLLV
jgi:hypothetical protein